MKKSGFVVLKALGVILALLFALSCSNPTQEIETERASIKHPINIVRSIMTVKPEDMYQQFTEQYQINPDKRILGSFRELLGFYQKLNPASTAAYRIGEAASDGQVTRISLYKNDKMFREFMLPLPCSFEKAMDALGLLMLSIYPDYLENGDLFASRALAILAYAKATRSIAVSREEALLAMVMGYKAHGKRMLAQAATPSNKTDQIIDAYLCKDMKKLLSLRGSESRVLSYYFLSRLYREIECRVRRGDSGRPSVLYRSGDLAFQMASA